MSTITGGNAPSGGPGRVHNYNAERAPGATDDITSGYLPASFWAWPAEDRVWVCTDGSEGAAQWAELAISSQISDGTNTVTAAQARSHIDSVANPHGVTAAQAGADPSGSAAAVQANLDTHEALTNNPHSVVASQVDITDAAGNFVATEVEAALTEEAGAREAVAADLATHEADLANPHGVTAAQAGADPAGSAAAVQTNLDTHEANIANPHAVTAAQAGAVAAGNAVKTYVGRIDGVSGSPDVELPDGWSFTRNGTGDYTITHNLNTSNYVVLAQGYDNKVIVYGVSGSRDHALNSVRLGRYSISLGAMQDGVFDFMLITY